MQNSTRISFQKELKIVEAELRRIDDERRKLLVRYKNLKKNLMILDIIEPQKTEGINKNSPSTEKIALFRKLFKGREDVFPRRFESSKTNKSGYQPVCSNEWKNGVCFKPKIKCSACKSRSFLAVTDEFIEAHLRGNLYGEPQRDFTMGIYPLLLDETCHFLAADFDKSTWAQDAAAYLNTCEKFDIPAYLERSRSGNGGHIWLFFEQPISARMARQLGTFLLTETMEHYSNLGFDSYDRFFPSQDTLPQGGFGNLIALPLQKRPRDAGNSVFIDPQTLLPDEDQWAALSSFQRISQNKIESVIQEAESKGGIIGVKAVEMDEEDETRISQPWEIPPSEVLPVKPIDGDLPERINLVLGNAVYIAKAEMTPTLRNRIMRLAAFQNPEFYRAQAMRFPTWDKPRIISCCRDYPNHIALPRGCLSDIIDFLQMHNIEVIIEDKRFGGERVNFKFNGKLRPLQKKAADELLRFDCGVLCASTAFGKTVVATSIIAKRKVNTLVLVHRGQLMEQWISRLSTFLNIDPSEIGRIGGGKRHITGKLDVATIQSLYSKGVVDDVVAGYGQIIVDECHHLSAQSFEAVSEKCKGKYFLGLSATVMRQDGHHPIIFMQCGSVRFKVNDRQQALERPFVHRVIVRNTEFSLPPPLAERQDLKIYEIYEALTADDTRNAMIVDDVLAAVRDGRSPVVITERKEHLEKLAEALSPHVQNVVLLHGGVGAKQRREIFKNLDNIPETEQRVIVATGKYLGEGYDDSRLDTLFLTMPVSWKGTISQYAGRLHRLNDMKKDVIIYDYLDEILMLQKMFKKRQQGYKAIGYSIE